MDGPPLGLDDPMVDQVNLANARRLSLPLARSDHAEAPFRNVDLVLDPSACTHGLGNIQRWFEKSYYDSQMQPKNCKVHLNVYVPTFTLHELEMQRKGMTLNSIKAAEAVKFIDSVVQQEEELALDALSLDEIHEHPADSSSHAPLPSVAKNESGGLTHNTHLEYRPDRYPSWDECVSKQIRVPEVGELPPLSPLDRDTNGVPQVPARLRSLIRSCIFLTHVRVKDTLNHGWHWRLVTEDKLTKIWASSFGIECLNINEAELLLFQGKDVAHPLISLAGADFFDATDRYQKAPDLLHQRVSTTSYKYEKLKGKRKTKSKADDSAPAQKSQYVTRNEDGLVSEAFGVISFAPRDGKEKLVISSIFKNNLAPHKKHAKRRGKKGENSQDETAEAGEAQTSKPKRGNRRKLKAAKKTAADGPKTESPKAEVIEADNT